MIDMEYEFKSCEVVTTSTGRKTTPFPKYKSIQHFIDSKEITTSIFFKEIGHWLLLNAYNEAISRGSVVNALAFHNTKKKEYTTSEIYSACSYLFDPDWSKL